jgi:hypothetical protein
VENLLHRRVVGDNFAPFVQLRLRLWCISYGNVLRLWMYGV